MKYILMDYVNEAGWPQLTKDLKQSRRDRMFIDRGTEGIFWEPQRSEMCSLRQRTRKNISLRRSWEPYLRHVL